ncbi:MAG: hypothetical protein IPF77_03040 [Gemmatimonadetes bacterium]|nr:hypothetical protein [Gemmatimonadota bacterium]
MAISAESGAPPETKYRSRPPVRATSLENTSLSASAFFTPSANGTGWPASTVSAHASPAARHQSKIRFLSGEAAAPSTTLA